MPFQGLPGFFRRSLSTLVPGGYTFPGLYRTFLSLPDRRGPPCVAPPGAELGPASSGPGPSQPDPRRGGSGGGGLCAGTVGG